MNEQGLEIEPDMAFGGGLARAISQALNYQKVTILGISFDKFGRTSRVPSGLVVKQILKIVRWGLTH
jgi:hypothetical protein